VIFRGDAVRDRPQDIQFFVRAWFWAINYWKAYPDEGNAIAASLLHLKPEAVALNGEKLYSKKDNLRLFTPGATNDSLYYTTKQYADFYIRKGALSTVPDINKLLVPTFVQGVKVE
jgi:NitT/TauT family transport system substrate-binding protein